jgi:multidrug efflux pump subunit AcrB
VAGILRAQPEVESVTQRVHVGNAYVAARLKRDRDRTSIEFERALAPRLARIADARVSFRSQFGGRDVEITLGGEDPAELQQVANQLVEQMGSIRELTAPRIGGNLPTPEIVIHPRLDLAASMGVTTGALSNAIRIATLGEIDQNTAKFSLSDRQIPIRTALDQDARERMATIENLPVPTTSGGSVPLHVVADIGFGSGPSQIDRTNQMRQITVGADLASGAVSGVAREKIAQLPIMKHLPAGVQELIVGNAKWQQELIQSFIIAVLSGIFLVFAVLVLLYRRFMSPQVNMGSLLHAPLGGLLGLLITRKPM